MLAALVSGLALLTSCSNGKKYLSVFPQEDGTNVMIVSGPTEDVAYRRSAYEGEVYCEDRGKKFVVISQKENEIEEEKKEEAGWSDVAYAYVTHRREENDRYRVETVFRCK